MSKKFDFHQQAKLKSEKRRQLLPPKDVLSKLELDQVKTFVDYGCGNGYFTIPVAQELVRTNGKVIAVDVEIEMLKELEKDIKENYLSNIELVLAEETKSSLPDSFADLVLLGFVLHELDEHELFQEVHRLIINGGKIAVLEWQRKEGEFGPPINQRIAAEQVANLLAASKFTHIQVYPINSQIYLVTGVK